jgi:chromosome segregation ATPase
LSLGSDSAVSERSVTKHLRRQLGDLQHMSNSLKLSQRNLKQEVGVLNIALAEAARVREGLERCIHSLEREKQVLEAEVVGLKAQLVVRENAHTISTHERDLLLRELSQQLYDAREGADALKRKLRARHQDIHFNSTASRKVSFL